MTDRRTTRYPSCRGATGARLILDSSFFEWRGPLFEYLGSGSPPDTDFAGGSRLAT